MAKIALADVKPFLDIQTGTTDYDGIIPGMIDFAYGYLDNYIGHDPAADLFKEYRAVKDALFSISALSTDAILQSVKIDGVAIDVSADIERQDFYRWEIVNDDYTAGEKAYLEYKSANLLAKVKKILLEIIVFELNKTPLFNNSISKKTKSVEGQVSESFVTDDAFYEQINRQLGNLFHKGI